MILDYASIVYRFQVRDQCRRGNECGEELASYNVFNSVF